MHTDKGRLFKSEALSHMFNGPIAVWKQKNILTRAEPSYLPLLFSLVICVLFPTQAEPVEFSASWMGPLGKQRPNRPSESPEVAGVWPSQTDGEGDRRRGGEGKKRRGGEKRRTRDQMKC